MRQDLTIADVPFLSKLERAWESLGIRRRLRKPSRVLHPRDGKPDNRFPILLLCNLASILFDRSEDQAAVKWE